MRYLPAFVTFSLLVAVGLLANGQEQSEANRSNKPNFPDEVEGAKLLTPRSYGFEFDPAPAQSFENQPVNVRTRSGETVVGLLYCRVGDNAVVMMPDGQLEGYAWSDIAFSESKFKPARKQDVGKQLQENGFGDFAVESSRNYVFVYNTSPRFLTVTKSILESMRKGVMKQLERDGFEIENPKVPQVVIMFGSQEQFQRYKPMPPGVVAYYNMVNNHVVLYEPSRRNNVRLDVIQGQALSTIAHEGAHQLLHNVGIQKRLSLWPMWLSEGLAEYYAPTSFGNRFRWKGAGVINDLRMFDLENYLQARELFGLDGATIVDSVGAARLDSTGYATAWSIVHYLAEHQREDLINYIKYISQLDPLQGMASRSDVVEENIEHFKTFFGEDFKSIEEKLIAHLQNQKYDSPMAHLPHYVVFVRYEDAGKAKRRGCIYHSRDLAEQWKEKFLSSLTANQKSSVQTELSRFENRDLAAHQLGRFLN